MSSRLPSVTNSHYYLNGAYSVFNPIVKMSVVSVSLAISPLALSYAETAPKTVINLNSQPLVSALSQLSKQSKIQIFVRDSLIRGIDAPKINSATSVKMALQQLLKETNLQAVWQGPNSVVIKLKSVEEKVSANEINRDDYANVTDVENIETIVVNGEKLNRYRNLDAASTLRSDVAILDLSRSIQVLNSEFIDDIDVSRIEEALTYVSGTATRQRMGGVDTQYYIRGFRESYTYRNGQREGFNARVNMNTIETVEVLKGPASVNFGVNAPGGIVNYTTKKPQAEKKGSFKFRFDEHGKKEFIGDITGSANDNDSVLYRFIGAAENSESYRDFTEQKSYTIAPSLTFQLSENTKLTTALEMHHLELPIDRGIPLLELGDGTYEVVDVPLDRVTTEPGDGSIDDKEFIDITLSHAFNLDWRTEFTYSYQHWENNWKETQIDEFISQDGEVDGIAVVQGDIFRGAYGYTAKDKKSHHASVLLLGDFELGNIRHKLTLGGDYGKSDFEGTWGEGALQPSEEYPTIFNIYRPVYGEFQSDLTPMYDEFGRARNWGIFASDTAYLGEKFIVNLALRYNDFSEKESDTDGWESEVDDSAVVWNTGLLYKAMPELSLYTSYATSYQPNSAANVIGEVKSSEGKQWEIGIKGIAFEDSLQYSLVYYDIVKSNIPNNLKDSNGKRIVKLIGEQTSKGIELDSSWQVTEGLTIQLSLAYTDAEVSKDEKNPDWVGHTPEGIPEKSGSIFVNYQLLSILPELNLYLGINYFDDVPNDEDNVYFLPGYSKIDVGLKYHMAITQNDGVEFKAGIKNLSDEVIYLQNGHQEIGIGQTKTLYANIEYKF